MKKIRYIVYLMYSYYSKGPRSRVAYMSAILAITFMVCITLFVIGALFNLVGYLPINGKDPKIVKYFKVALFQSPVFFYLYYAVKEKKLLELREEFGPEHFDKEFYHRTLVFFYFIGIMIVFVILAILNKSRQ